MPQSLSVYFLLRYFLVLYLATVAQPSTAQFKIMCLGNSITQGNLEHPGYKYRLWQKLVDAGVDFEFVGSHDVNNGGTPAVKGEVRNGKVFTNRNEGHWGWRTDEILNGEDGGSSTNNLSVWLQSYTPDIVLMHLGTNDVFQQQSISSTLDELRTVAAQLRSKNPNVVILMAKLIPAYDQVAGPDIAASIEELNTYLPSLAEELHTTASPVVLVDQYTNFNATTGADTWDGIHPNGSGEEKMATIWYNAMQPYITPLPVELSYFEARAGNSGEVQLQWATASEQDNAYFAVQRSADGITFKELARVQGAGNSAVQQNYTYTDTLAPAGNLYYRLLQTDHDGSFSYSKTMQVRVPERARALQVYPTSSSGENVQVTLQHHQPDTPATLQVYTPEGKLVHQKKNITGSNGTFRLSIPFRALEGAGLYLVRMVSGETVYQSEFILQR